MFFRESRQQRNYTKLVFALDITGTFVFALEGASTAIANHLDLLGVMALAFSAALAGGILRDLLIGAVPPRSFKDWRLPTTAFTAALLVYFFNHFVEEIPDAILLIFDAVGLALFATSGTAKALEYKISPLLSIMLGTITGVGGSVVVSVLLAKVPTVLYTHVYASAAIAGSTIMMLAIKLKIKPQWAAVMGGLSCFALRLISVLETWTLPKPPS